MKNKITFFFFCIILCQINFIKILADELIFETNEIKISDNGNLINASDGLVKAPADNIEIKAKKFIYNKNLSIVTATGDVIVKVPANNIEIKAKKFIYNKNLSTMRAMGDVEVNDLNRNILIETQNIFYNIKDKLVKSDTESSIVDSFDNIFLMKSFVYTLNDKLIKIKDVKLIDIEKNTYLIDKAYINLKSNKLIGKDISIDFNNFSFNKGNAPRLKGKTVSSNNNETVVQNGVFTICKKTDDCPPWQISAKSIKHDKEKKTIYYKNAWLKLYDKPVFYFPKFFHPDPTVKRQSGFLMPSFVDSSSLGVSMNIPYYHVISDNRDLTIKPRFYSYEKVLLQSEYREINSKSKHTLDFSVMGEASKSTKSHFFSTTNRRLDFLNFDESELNLNLQHSPNDTYLKTYKLKSPIIKNNTLLTSSLGISAYRQDFSFETEFQVFEDLSKKSSDRYEFIYPSYNLTKQLDIESKLNGIYSLNSSGYIKNYDTNVYEKILINDLIFNSDSIFSKNGFKSGYNFLIKNVNTNAENSKAYRQTRDHKLSSIFEFNSSYPLKKEVNNFTNVLKPRVSLKLSPNKSKNMRNESRRIDINNIYSLNRIGVNDTTEGGESFTYGVEFSKSNKSDKEIIGAKIANILRLKENKELPRNSTIGNKTSNVVGNLNYSPNNILSMNYDFSLDENLSDKNYELLGSKIKINNFITSFEYLNENNGSDDTSYLTNKTTYLINDSKNFIFETRENKKTKFTEFYNLIYQYYNDCLIASIEYNKDYYSDGDLKPEENIFLKLTIIPFGQTSSPNLIK